MITLNMASAPLSPAISTNICSTGCPYSLLSVLSKSWMENKYVMITKKPNSELNPTLEMTPIGALQLAFRVSSLKCTLASKPVSVIGDEGSNTS